MKSCSAEEMPLATQVACPCLKMIIPTNGKSYHNRNICQNNRNVIFALTITFSHSTSHT